MTDETPRVTADVWAHRMGFGRNEPEEESGYQAFRACAPGEVMSVELVPGDPARPGFEIGYFQTWTVRFLDDSQVAILCPSASLIVFIEGRKLNDLRRRLRERRIASIHEYSRDVHGEIEPGAAVVTSIKVEMTNDLDAIHSWQSSNSS